MHRLTRAARTTASCALYTAHMLLVLWAASAAGAFSWRSGYTLPYDTSDTALLTAATLFTLLAGGAVATLPEPWLTKARFAIKGRPLENCSECGELIETVKSPAAQPLALQNGEKTHPKETSR
ncbi:hypothetical protein ACOMD4_37815 [Streptomyces anulatus]|uniref:hypothetical protein n=1 Tax=Streptomyces anulatus TaxID=1892 RepID=UPI003B7E8BFD